MCINMLAVLAMLQVPAGPPTPTRAAPVPRISDARILGTLGASDANQIEAATLAATKASTSELRAFAKAMVLAHQRSLQQNSDLAKRLEISRMLPADSTMARSHKLEMYGLNVMTGVDFDLTFLQNLVADHATLFNASKTAFVPGAVDPAVKAFVQAAMPTMAAHQAQAQGWLDKWK